MGFFVAQPTPESLPVVDESLSIFYPDDSIFAGADKDNWMSWNTSTGTNPGPGVWLNPTTGDWYDINGTPQGNASWGTLATRQFNNSGPEFTLAIQGLKVLVDNWISAAWPNTGITLQGTAGLRSTFRGRRWSTVEERPILRLLDANGIPRDVVADSSTHINSSTTLPHTGTDINVGLGNTALLRFDVSDVVGPVISAELRLRFYAFSGSGTQTISVYRTRIDAAADGVQTLGVAAAEPYDEFLYNAFQNGLARLAQDPNADPLYGISYYWDFRDVADGAVPDFTAHAFDSEPDAAGLISNPEAVKVVGATDPIDPFYEPPGGNMKALRLHLSSNPITGSSNYLNSLLSIRSIWGKEWPGFTDELYGGEYSVRYLLRFGNNWPPIQTLGAQDTTPTGKLPGIACMKMEAGNGGMGRQLALAKVVSWSGNGQMLEGGNGTGRSTGARGMSLRGLLHCVWDQHIDPTTKEPLPDSNGHLMVDGGILASYEYKAGQNTLNGSGENVEWSGTKTRYNMPRKNTWSSVCHRVKPNTMDATGATKLYLTNRRLFVCRGPTWPTDFTGSNIGYGANAFGRLNGAHSAGATVLNLKTDCSKFAPASGKGCAGTTLSVLGTTYTIVSITATQATISSGLVAGSYPDNTFVIFPDDAIVEHDRAYIGNNSGWFYHSTVLDDQPIIADSFQSETPDSAIVDARTVGGGVGVPDGTHRIYVDNVLVLERTGLMWRHVPDIGPLLPWLCFQVGGTTSSIQTVPTWMYITGITVSKDYVGGLQTEELAPAAWAPSTPNSTAVVNFPSGTGRNIQSVEPGAGIWSPAAGQSLFNSIVPNWNSGVYVPGYKGNRGLFVFHGGGHAGYAGCTPFDYEVENRRWKSPVAHPNSGYTGMDGMTAPKSSILDDSIICPVQGVPTEKSKWGEPVGHDQIFPPHTYDTIFFLPPEDGGGEQGSICYGNRAFFYQLSGCLRAHRYDLARRRSYRLTGASDTVVGASQGDVLSLSHTSWVYDSFRKKAYGIGRSDAFNGSFLNNVFSLNFPTVGPIDGNCFYTRLTPAGGAGNVMGSVISGYLTGVFWPGQNVAVWIMPRGSGGTPSFGLQIAIFDPTANTFRAVTLSGDFNPSTGLLTTATGAPLFPFNNAAGFVYCPDLDCFYIAPWLTGDATYVNYNIPSFYKLTPSVGDIYGTWTVTEQIIPEASRPTPRSPVGWHKRLGWNARDKSLIWFHQIDDTYGKMWEWRPPDFV